MSHALRLGHLRRGSSLIEMLVVMALLAGFGLVSARLFVTTARLTRQAQIAPAALGHLDQTIAELRQDVWNSQSVRVSGPDRVVLRQAGREIRWQYVLPAGDTPATLVRTVVPAAPEPERTRTHRLPGGQPAFAFAPRPAGLALEWPQLGGPPRRVILASQVQLASPGGAPAAPPTQEASR